MEPPSDYTALGYNLDLPWIMSFLLVPHLIGWLPESVERLLQTDRQTLRKLRYRYIFPLLLCVLVQCFHSHRLLWLILILLLILIWNHRKCGFLNNFIIPNYYIFLKIAGFLSAITLEMIEL